LTSELAEAKVGKGEEDLRCNRLLTACQRRRGLAEGAQWLMQSRIEKFDSRTGTLLSDKRKCQTEVKLPVLSEIFVFKLLNYSISFAREQRFSEHSYYAV